MWFFENSVALTVFGGIAVSETVSRKFVKYQMIYIYLGRNTFVKAGLRNRGFPEQAAFALSPLHQAFPCAHACALTMSKMLIVCQALTVDIGLLQTLLFSKSG